METHTFLSSKESLQVVDFGEPIGLPFLNSHLVAIIHMFAAFPAMNLHAEKFQETLIT